MKWILIAYIVLSTLTVLTFLLELKVIPKLGEDSKFKLWWRKHVIGEYNGPEDLW